jgi:hypothetical protein
MGAQACLEPETHSAGTTPDVRGLSRRAASSISGPRATFLHTCLLLSCYRGAFALVFRE